jgi:hypothetical protein
VGSSQLEEMWEVHSLKGNVGSSQLEEMWEAPSLKGNVGSSQLEEMWEVHSLKGQMWETHSLEHCDVGKCGKHTAWGTVMWGNVGTTQLEALMWETDSLKKCGNHTAWGTDVGSSQLEEMWEVHSLKGQIWETHSLEHCDVGKYGKHTAWGTVMWEECGKYLIQDLK